MTASSAERLPVHLYFRLAFGITWGAGAIGLLVSNTAGLPFAQSSPLYFLAGYGPSLAGVLTAVWFGGLPAFRKLFLRLIPRRAALACIPVVVIGYPAVAFGLTYLLGTPSEVPTPSWNHVPVLFAATLLTDTGPLGEEFGWRGFALPQIMGWRSPAAAGLVVGVFWAAWHLPTFFISTLSQSHAFIPLFLLGTVALSVVQTRLWIESDGNLALAVLLHVTTNFWAPFLPASTFIFTNVLLAGLALTTSRMWTPPAASGRPH